jgi:hypothetical protein
MMDYLKYLPLLQVAANHPNLVALFNQIATTVQPHIPEIESALAEAEAIIQKIDPPVIVKG